MNRVGGRGTDLRWYVLGPVEAATKDRTAPLARPQQKAVLAYLLLNADAVVSTRQLTNALWGTSPPATARTQIHACISQIRRALRTVDIQDRLVSQAGGYRIDVEPGELDVAEFDGRVRLARTAADAGRLAEAVELLRDGLSRWRGSPLSGAAGDFVTAAATGLEEQRLRARAQLAEAQIALSEHGPAVTALRPLVAAHPTREQLVGLLMTALTGCGQQVEALRLYEDTRRTLAEEFGIEPGAELTRVHLRVLRRQIPVPEEPPLPAEARPVLPRPAQLPAGIAGFAGRDAYLDRLNEITAKQQGHAAAGTVIIAIAGDAGVGKSALAVHWAHQVCDDYPDGQLYAKLRGFDPGGTVADPAETVREFLAALGVPAERVPESLDAQTGLYRSLLSKRRMLIVLDNARDAEQVRPLLPGSPGCLVVITSRNRLSGLQINDAAHAVTLELMDATDARRLLGHRLGAQRVSAEPAAVAEIIEFCTGLPLALAIAAARAAGRPGVGLAELAGQLRDAGQRLDTLSGGDTTTDLRTVFSWSYRALSPEAARLFRLLSVHPGPDFAVSSAASLAAVPVTGMTPILAELARLHLIAEPGHGRYTVHDLLRVYAGDLAETVDGEEHLGRARRRILDHYLHTGHAMDRMLNPQRDAIEPSAPEPGVVAETPADREQTFGWFKAERATVGACVRLAAAFGFGRHAWQLALTVGTFYDRQGHWHDWRSILCTALEAVRLTDDRVGQAYVHLGLAHADGRLRETDPALRSARRALELFDDLEDRRGAAKTHLILGWLLERRERYREALEHDWRAFELNKAIGHRVGQARVLNSIGWHHAMLGDFQRTLEYCRQSLELQREFDDLHGQSASWDSLGFAHDRLGRHGDAISCYRNALDLRRRLGERYITARTLSRLGDAYQRAGDGEGAEESWREAVRILDDLGHPEADNIRAGLQG